MIFYAHRNYGNAVFVKTEAYFVEQGGKNQAWGQGWKRIEANDLNDARNIAEKTLPRNGDDLEDK